VRKLSETGRRANPWLVVVLSLLLCAGACNRKTKAEQLAALDSAYQSGILTKDEYDAKKIALLGSFTAPAAPVAPIAPVAVTPAPTPAATTAPARPKEVAGTPKTQAGPEVAPLAGCSDQEYKSSNGNGPQERFFPMPLATVKRAAAEALKTLDFDIHKNTNNEIEASKKRHIGVLIGAGGEREILRFKETQLGNQKGTRVTGETKKTFVGRAAQKSWTNAVLAQTACGLRDASRR
jgi:hypothetical protein